MRRNLLEGINDIYEKYNLEYSKSGGYFNLISLLGMEEYETRTHSKIIAELLDSKGSHGFGNAFFKLFIQELNIEMSFDFSNYQVLTEEYVGEIAITNGKMRTFLDIVIKDLTEDKLILIENKIWANDQFEQLERYFDSYSDRNIVKLFYLNVFEGNYDFNYNYDDSPTQSKKKDALNRVYEGITYETHIKKWLEKCILFSKENHFVSNQIQAYYNIVLKISNQNQDKKMNNDIVNYILDNNFVKEFYLLEKNRRSLEKEIIKRFFNAVIGDVTMPDNIGQKDSFLLCYKVETTTVSLIFEQENSGLYICIESEKDLRDFENQSFNFKFYPTDSNRLIKYVDYCYNNVSFDELLSEENVKNFRDLLLRVKTSVDRFASK